jgi:hypothetical protein
MRRLLSQGGDVMKRYGLLVGIGLALLLPAYVLHTGGWFRQARQDSKGEPSRVQKCDPMSSAAGWRFIHAQPHHWRQVMLQR